MVEKRLKALEGERQGLEGVVEEDEEEEEEKIIANVEREVDDDGFVFGSRLGKEGWEDEGVGKFLKFCLAKAGAEESEKGIFLDTAWQIMEWKGKGTGGKLGDKEAGEYIDVIGAAMRRTDTWNTQLHFYASLTRILWIVMKNCSHVVFCSMASRLEIVSGKRYEQLLMLAKSQLCKSSKPYREGVASNIILVIELWVEICKRDENVILARREFLRVAKQILAVGLSTQLVWRLFVAMKECEVGLDDDVDVDVDVDGLIEYFVPTLAFSKLLNANRSNKALLSSMRGKVARDDKWRTVFLALPEIGMIGRQGLQVVIDRMWDRKEGVGVRVRAVEFVVGVLSRGTWVGSVGEGGDVEEFQNCEAEMRGVALLLNDGGGEFLKKCAGGGGGRGEEEMGKAMAMLLLFLFSVGERFRGEFLVTKGSVEIVENLIDMIGKEKGWSCGALLKLVEGGEKERCECIWNIGESRGLGKVLADNMKLGGCGQLLVTIGKWVDEAGCGPAMVMGNIDGEVVGRILFLACRSGSVAELSDEVRVKILVWVDCVGRKFDKSYELEEWIEKFTNIIRKEK